MRHSLGLALLVVCVLSLGCVPASMRRSADVLSYLYPEGGVAQSAPEVHLQIPLRVGIAFAPTGSKSLRSSSFTDTAGWSYSYQGIEDAFSEPQQRELLKRVAAAFRGLPEVSLVEILPTHSLAASPGFDGLAQIAGMYGLSLVALVSYDQVQFDDQDFSSLLYWTIVGAYVVPADVHETRTLLDASIFDVKSRALLFTGSGSSIVKGRSTANGVRRDMRNKSLEGFELATDDMISNLKVSLDVFRENAKRGTVRGLGTPTVQIHREVPHSSGAGAVGVAETFGGLLLALGAWLAAWTRPARTRVPWLTFGLVAAAVWVSFGPGAPWLADRLVFDRAALLQGEAWRLLGAHLVHGWPQLALFDLGAIAVCGALIEQRSRSLLGYTLLLAAVCASGSVLMLRPDLALYQGSSALASALFVVAAAGLTRAPASTLLVAFALKLALEAAGAWPSPATPAGVETVALAHVVGALAGTFVALAEHRSARTRWCYSNSMSRT